MRSLLRAGQRRPEEAGLVHGAKRLGLAALGVDEGRRQSSRIAAPNQIGQGFGGEKRQITSGYQESRVREPFKGRQNSGKRPPTGKGIDKPFPIGEQGIVDLI